MGANSKSRHNLGNAFIGALDDIRQKVVERGWTGEVQTPSQQLDTKYSDFVAWLYNRGGEKEKSQNVQDGLGADSPPQAGPTRPPQAETASLPQANTTAAWVARGVANLEAGREGGETGLQAAYSAFVDRCEKSGIDPSDREVSDFFWSGHAHGGSTFDWVNGASRSTQTPAIEAPDRGEDQGIEL